MKPIAYASNQRKEVEDDQWGAIVTTITLAEELPDSAIASIDSFSHLEVVFYFHKVKEDKIIQGARHPRNNKDYPLTGIFAQRGKNRPNRIGLTTVELLEVEGRSMIVKGLDCIDGTPILDIKPVMEEFLPKSSLKQPDWTRDVMRKYWDTAQ